MIAATSQDADLLSNFTRMLEAEPEQSTLDMDRIANATTDASMEETGRPKYPYASWAMIFTSIPVGLIIFTIVFGNALVIVAVLRDSHLKRQPQNWLIVSLAAADLLVGLLIMPLTLTYELLDEWTLGTVLCELWLALDVLFVTASILNLCAISLDRYWSLTIPTSYPQGRTPRRMLLMIMVVWLSAFAISFPPLVGWRPEEQPVGDCVLSDQLGYVMYSAFGSFYIPVFVLLFVYARIYCISRKRKKKSVVGPIPQLRKEKSLAARLRQLVTPRRPKLAQPQPQPLPQLKPIEKPTIDHTVSSKEDLLNGSVTNGVPPSSPSTATTDYAAVIARVRALATLRHDSLVITEEIGGRKLISTSIGADSPIIFAPEISSGDGLSHVMAIAAAAAAHSRQEHRSESLTAKAYELQDQLRQRRKLVRRRERQATVVLGFVLGSFVVCWMPFFCSYLLSAICCKTPDLVFDVIFWLGYCNSAFNPIIYNFFNRDFRRAFRRILCESISRRLDFLSSSLSSFQLRDNKANRKRQVPSTTATALSETQRRKRDGRLLRRNSMCSSFDNDE